jgi:hypothetical protein
LCRVNSEGMPLTEFSLGNAVNVPWWKEPVPTAKHR